jgi:hypothetical protein
LKLHPKQKTILYFSLMQQLIFLLILSASKIAKIKCLFLTKSGKIYHPHTRGMGSPTCRSVLLQEKNILNRSLMWKVLKVNG